MYDPMFVPPRSHPLLVRFCTGMLPALAHLLGNIRGVAVPPEELDRLRALGPHRAIIAPNHPTGMDPIVTFWLARLTRQPFYHLAAREVLVGPKGWLMNRLGTYSVIRGVPDRESIRTTRRLLAEQERKVVIFPEGEIYEHNDRLLAFQSGVPQIGFWVLDDLQKAGRKLSMPIVPVAIKYRCCDQPRPAIENSLTQLEQALDLPRTPKSTAYQRLRRIGDRVLTALEREEGLKSGPGEDLNARIPRVRQAILSRIARAIGTEVDPAQPPADQLHRLFHDLRSWVGLLPDDAADYDERLYRHKMDVAGPLFNDLYRLQNFIAVTGDYVAAEATAERFLEVLGRLETEVLGEVRHRVPREALLRIAPPIRLEERYEAYRASRRQVVAEVTREIETSIRERLRELSREATPIALEA